MRKCLMILGVVCLCATGALAQSQGKVSSAWTCGKPAMANSIEVGDQPNHTYAIDQFKCTATRGEIAGAKEQEGTGTEFFENRGNRSRGHGIFVETLANGDMLHVAYQMVATLKDGQVVSASDRWQVISGTGKVKGIKGSGSCKGAASADGSANWTCTGTYTLPK